MRTTRYVLLVFILALTVFLYLQMAMRLHTSYRPLEFFVDPTTSTTLAASVTPPPPLPVSTAATATTATSTPATAPSTATTSIAPGASGASATPTLGPSLDIQCPDCTQYFGEGAAALGDAAALPTYADAQATLLSKALDGLNAFIKDKTKFCDEPPKDVQSYTTCLYNYIASTVITPCITDGTGADLLNGRNKAKCSIIQSLVDDVMAKAAVCKADCDNLSKYPREDERLQCKKTGQCNSLDELESNMKTQVDIYRSHILSCKTSLSDPTSTCYKYFARLIQVKQDSVKALAAASQYDAAMPKLSTMYGEVPANFDTATLVLANQT